MRLETRQPTQGQWQSHWERKRKIVCRCPVCPCILAPRLRDSLTLCLTSVAALWPWTCPSIPLNSTHCLHNTRFVCVVRKGQHQSEVWWIDNYYKNVLFSCQVVSNSASPWTAARQASLSLTISWSLPNFMSIESVMPLSHLILMMLFITFWILEIAKYFIKWCLLLLYFDYFVSYGSDPLVKPSVHHHSVNTCPAAHP